MGGCSSGSGVTALTWYGWVLLGAVVVLGWNLFRGYVAQRKHDRFWATQPLPILTEVHHARWTASGHGARFYLASSDHLEWRYDHEVEPDFDNMLQAEIELTALELRLGRRVTFPRSLAQAHALNERRARELGEPAEGASPPAAS